MKLTPEERNTVISLEMQKAKNFFSQAEANAKIELWDVVANRLYYSLFHAASALLIHIEQPVSSQKGAIVQFNKYFVKTGIIDKQYGYTYAMLQQMSEKADYNCSYTATESEVQPLLSLSQQFISQITNLLQLPASEFISQEN